MIDFKVKKLKSVNSPVSVHGVYPYRGKISSLDAMKIIEQIPKGTTLLDPFCGSGTTGVAAIQQDREFIGIDLNKHYCGIAKKRVGNAKFVGDDEGIFSLGGS